jgi:hypothetical protein
MTTQLTKALELLKVTERSKSVYIQFEAECQLFDLFGIMLPAELSEYRKKALLMIDMNKYYAKKHRVC